MAKKSVNTDCWGNSVGGGGGGQKTTNIDKK